MALTFGTRLGPYAITAQIGVGGMGEDCRATDTKLKRDVAIKSTNAWGSSQCCLHADSSLGTIPRSAFALSERGVSHEGL